MYRSERSAWCRKAELSATLIQNTKEAPHGTYVLHRPGCTQAEDQLLRERGRRKGICRRMGTRHTFSRPCSLSSFTAQKLLQPLARFVYLGFRTSDLATDDLRDLVMLVAHHVVDPEACVLARGY